jgi:hypothetical protein
LKALPPAPTTEEAARGVNRGAPGASGGAPTGRVEAPSPQFRTSEEGNLFRVGVPSNWQELPGTNTVTFAPQGGYGQANGQSVFTYGVEIGVARNETHDLQTATGELISSLGQSNPNLRQSSNPAQASISGQRALHTVLTNRSDVTGQQETISVFTTLAQSGNLFYVIAVAPSSAFPQYRDVFGRIVSSIQLMN